MCVWWGDKYDISYLEYMKVMVDRSITHPFTLYVYTDRPTEVEALDNGMQAIPILIKGSHAHMNKYHMWSENVAPNNNPTICFDLDIIIKNNIDRIFDYIRPGMITLLDATWSKWIGEDRGIQANSSVMGWIPGTIERTFQRMYANEYEFEMRWNGIDRTLWNEMNDVVCLFESTLAYSRMLGIDEQCNFWVSGGDYNWECDRDICIFNGVGLLDMDDYLAVDPYNGFEEYRT